MEKHKLRYFNEYSGQVEMVERTVDEIIESPLNLNGLDIANVFIAIERSKRGLEPMPLYDSYDSYLEGHRPQTYKE